ncbi:MAG: NAD(P)/FAD-dependent oxidoreductase [Terrisporobacter othiniensis]|uniref:NAD(P)/FAD-dependent oxidoreductase n=1 Tax=Terrisporobacter petrolearius TaxID=1460447 RepID=UPI0008EB177E|nr:NAD(P)/FAD-dependent oxidoreductase [Terrisporobacter petrolearius]MDU4861560.1 NAD(P)/FAD-dependent oxidoreductase [Terrisporobacter othiniensis]MDU6995521.1 NAD(P)/FAD-dependent oxidoreductase [Terrisporobacter othiniensis]UPA30885.1 NAD(P)/FAD-dependent oxidoreductase [Terrisporobacter glycolicus]SFJ50796.1 thioredoxin reductase (NADPH) [Terrisporobacter glycolicus]
MSDRIDIAIIGSGPAGVSAALNASIRKKTFKIFGSKEISQKLVKAHKVNNYLGFYGKSGLEIRDEFAKHLESMDIDITEDKINNIYSMGDYFALMGTNNNYEAKTVILATGVNFGKPLKGEEEFLGRGVGYCATCDAPLYKDKVVTIISYNKHEESEANFIAQVASKVYYIPMYKEEVEVDSSIEVIKDTPVEIVGEKFVEKLVLKDREIETDGIFILRDSISPGQLVPGLQLDGNHIDVDRKMSTNLKGCFAAGDIVGTPYQYIKAAGEGNIAALSAVSYLDELRRNNK